MAMTLNLKIWRQRSSQEKGKMVDYKLDNVSEDVSFLEMLDYLNESLVKKGEEPVVFEHDCREGICGCCSLVINGIPHGDQKETTTCQLHMRHFKDGDTIYIEPYRSKAFPIIRDLMVDRTSFDKIIQSGGYTSIRCGSAPEANSIPVPKQDAEIAMDGAQCIGCGACVAACKNASAMLFVSAKVSQMAHLPQGKVEAKIRVRNMVGKMDQLGFGNCTNEEECEAVCPKNVGVSHITVLNKEFLRGNL